MKVVTWHSSEGLVIKENDGPLAGEVPDELLNELKEAKERVEEIEAKIHEMARAANG